MKYIKDTLQHTDQVMQTYHVNSLLAKVIESKNMGLSEYEKFVSPHLIYHDFSLMSYSCEGFPAEYKRLTGSYRAP